MMAANRPAPRVLVVVVAASAMIVFGVSTAGCSGSSADDGDARGAATTTTTSPALPEEEPAATPALPIALLAAAPTCGAPGAHVLLSLDWTSDKRVPDCVHPERFSVTFGSKKAQVTMAGKNNYGYCAVDVIVPAKADSGVVTVRIDGDVFESRDAFAVPCR